MILDKRAELRGAVSLALSEGLSITSLEAETRIGKWEIERFVKGERALSFQRLLDLEAALHRLRPLSRVNGHGAVR